MNDQTPEEELFVRADRGSIIAGRDINITCGSTPGESSKTVQITLRRTHKTTVELSAAQYEELMDQDPFQLTRAGGWFSRWINTAQGWEDDYEIYCDGEQIA